MPIPLHIHLYPITLQVSTFISSLCILPVFPFVNANVSCCICVCILSFPLFYTKGCIINTILWLPFYFTMLELFLAYQ